MKKNEAQKKDPDLGRCTYQITRISFSADEEGESLAPAVQNPCVTTDYLSETQGTDQKRDQGQLRRLCVCICWVSTPGRDSWSGYFLTVSNGNKEQNC